MMDAIRDFQGRNELKKLLKALDVILGKDLELGGDGEVSKGLELNLVGLVDESFKKSDAPNKTGRFNNLSKDTDDITKAQEKDDTFKSSESDRATALKDLLRDKNSSITSSRWGRSIIKDEISENDSLINLNENSGFNMLLEEIGKDSLRDTNNLTLNDAYSDHSIQHDNSIHTPEDAGQSEYYKEVLKEHKNGEQPAMVKTQPVQFVKESETETGFKKLLVESRNFLNGKMLREKKLCLSEKATLRVKEFPGNKMKKAETKENTSIEPFYEFGRRKAGENREIAACDKEDLQSDERDCPLSVEGAENNSLMSNEENAYSLQEAINKVKSGTLQSPLNFEKNLPPESTIRSQASIHSSEDALPSARTEDLFEEYTKKDPFSRSSEKSYLLRLSASTYLRYISLKDLLYDLQSTAIKKSNRISREDFVEVVASLAGGVAGEVAGVGELYETLQGPSKSRLALEELAGGLAALCLGKMQDNIRIAFVYTGSKNGRVNFATIFNFLQSLYKLFLSHPTTSLKNSNTTTQELSKATTLQCFDDHGRAYTQTLSIAEFTGWFTCEAKTLAPFCEDGEDSRLSARSGRDAACADLQESQRLWKEFLDGYYQVYGFYPPPPPLPSHHKTMEFTPEAGAGRNYEGSGSRKRSMARTSKSSTKHSRTLYTSKVPQAFDCSRGYI